jgi:hypothetical protein
MALLTKKILPVGKYNVSSNKGRLLKEFDESYLRKVVENSNKMIAAGLMIPAVFKHRQDAIPRDDAEWKAFEVEVNKSADPFHNAGYWKRFWIAPDDKGKPSLFGEVDAPGEVTQTDSMAWKLANVNKEVSASITENFTDGKGRTWTDSLLHVAVVNHAVVPEQTPFEDSVTIVNMSMETEDNDDISTISELIVNLKKVNINLPGNTNKSTFLRDLNIALLQVAERDNTGDLIPAPIYMSIEDDMPITEAQAKALVATKALNPDTNKPFTMEDLGFKAAPPVAPVNLDLSAQLAAANAKIETQEGVIQAFMKQLVTKTTDTVQQRINTLIDAGKITKEYADANLQPKVAYNLSITADKQIADHPLELMLSALEAMPSPTKAASDPGTSHPNPFEDNSSTADEASVDKLLKEWESSGISFE